MKSWGVTNVTYLSEHGANAATRTDSTAYEITYLDQHHTTRTELVTFRWPDWKTAPGQVVEFMPLHSTQPHVLPWHRVLAISAPLAVWQLSKDGEPVELLAVAPNVQEVRFGEGIEANTQKELLSRVYPPRVSL